MAGPLDGIRVIDASTVVNGPWAAQTLGDYGADVIKVEPPQGDHSRQIGPARSSGMSSLFLGCNRNKRSIVLDLKQPAARDAMLRLVRGADVLMHNFRPRPAAALGLAYEQVAAVNSGIVWVATYGFRAAGPYRDKPAYDDVIQAGAGFAAIQAVVADEPRFIPTLVTDKVTGQAVVAAVLAALLCRERTGVGQAVEVPMFETAAAFLMVEHLEGATFIPPIESVGYKPHLVPWRRPLRTKDGYLAVLPATDDKWRAFFRLAGRADLAEDARFGTVAGRREHNEALYRVLGEIVATRTTGEWMDDLGRADIPAMVVNTLESLLDDPQLAATDFWREVNHPTEGRLRMPDIPARFHGTPGDVRRLAPRLGEHSREILHNLEYSAAEIDAMLASGATHE
jgi:crotonobetainyl-CoA:carnitine CoA-transferase CaiB-like acyl-CoA transferase